MIGIHPPAPSSSLQSGRQRRPLLHDYAFILSADNAILRRDSTRLISNHGNEDLQSDTSSRFQLRVDTTAVPTRRGKLAVRSEKLS
jgi:hypothetical protein